MISKHITYRLPVLLAIVAAVTLLLCPAQAAAQLSDEARASVWTVWPGDRLYATFGHTAIRITDPARGIDRVYNYGTFDFDGPGFYLKFLRGHLDYRLSTAPADLLLRHYRMEGRSVIEQELALQPAQVDALYRFLQTNYQPENRYYRYKFFFDNCSTRPRDALVQVIDSLQFHFRPDEELVSFRDHLDPYLQEWPLIHLGMDLALGAPSDKIATPYQAMFLPLQLMEKLEQATITSNGTTRPLVARTNTLYWNSPAEQSDASFPWISLPLWLLFAGALVQTVREVQYAGITPGWAYKLDALIFAAIGLIGLIITGLSIATAHDVADPNWNLLWAWPTHLIAAHFLWRRRLSPALRGYFLLAALASLITVLGWTWWPQELPLPVLPLVLWQTVRAGRHASIGTIKHRLRQTSNA